MKDFYNKYAELAIRFGVNLQKGQHLEIICPTECEDFGLTIAEEGYKRGAKTVHITWQNQKADRLNYIYAKTEDLCQIPKWFVMQKEALIDENACYVCIDSDDPMAYSGLDEEKISKHISAKVKAIKKYHDGVMANAIRWCVVSAPSKKWADMVFDGDVNSVEKLTNAIAMTMRLNEPDPVLSWTNHVKKLNAHADYLNSKNYSELHFTSSNGTNLHVGLCDDHVWCPAVEKAQDGVEFIANMPTEEVFTAPHKNRVNGVLKSALPLAVNGNVVDNFTITFKDGKITDFTAEKGYETLKQLIETDEGTHYLGEVAIIGKNSPIAKSGILFYSTLFDENASCHLAIGKGYPSSVKNGFNLSEKELLEKGLNDSVEHVDFMIGTADTKIIATTKTGEKEVIFDNGEWTI